MTDFGAACLDRNEFMARYLQIFNCIFVVEQASEIRFACSEEFETLFVADMNLTGWSCSETAFEAFLSFLDLPSVPSYLLLTEVQTTAMFTETWRVPTNPQLICSIWNKAKLPHFTTVCFDESAHWGAIFNNLTDSCLIGRRRNAIV